MDFGERLKSLRIKKNITQQELSDLMGVGRSTIAGYETKGKQPDFEKLKWLASFFNVSIDFLLNNNITNTIQLNPELTEFWNRMKKNESFQSLIEETKNMDEKELKQVLRIIKAIKDEEANE